MLAPFYRQDFQKVLMFPLICQVFFPKHTAQFFKYSGEFSCLKLNQKLMAGVLKDRSSKVKNETVVQAVMKLPSFGMTFWLLLDWNLRISRFSKNYGAENFRNLSYFLACVTPYYKYHSATLTYHSCSVWFYHRNWFASTIVTRNNIVWKHGP